MLLLERKRISKKWFNSDTEFNKLYPLPMQTLAARHWTMLNVAKKAADFLATEKDVKILDIGSGVGKFCLSAANYKPNASFYGIEQRKTLITHAEKANEILGLENVFFIHGNFTQLDFQDYDHFYFYNSFYENLAFTDKIDDSIDYSGELFNYYNRYLYLQLDKMPATTKLVTFYSMEEEVPKDYHVVGSDIDGLLKYWIKI